MAMVVQHNLTAMNSNRMLGVTTNMKSKSTEKLSSGYKINRAADDASGLAISEKMRKQIKGLTQASSNAQDGISAVQTAEGALAEVHDMLQRMNELAVKSANGTNSVSDRDAIQAEIDQLTTEIDRVAETTKFNETYLLKGDKSAVRGYTYNYAKVTAGMVSDTYFGADGKIAKTMRGAVTMTKDTATGIQVKVTFANTGATKTDSAGKTVSASTATAAQVNEIINALKTSGINVTATVSRDKTDSANVGDPELVYKVSLGGAVADKYTVVASSDAPSTDGVQKFYIKDAAGTTIATVKVSGITTSSGEGVYSTNSVATKVTAAYRLGESFGFYDKDGNKISANALDKYFTAATTGSGTTATTTNAARTDASSVYDAVGNKVKITNMAGQVRSTQDKMGKLQVGLHVGADATSNNQIKLNIESMSAKSLGVVGLKVDGETDENALSAIETIKAAINKVSDQRSSLGAAQNRLEHTIKNLDNVVENTTAAESQIRDTDMASEMVNYSKNNILSQAGQSMLAQANQSNQGVLSLLG